MAFPIITVALQREFEQTNRYTEAIPCICGYFGRACRQMEKIEGANRAICIGCELAEYVKERLQKMGRCDRIIQIANEENICCDVWDENEHIVAVKIDRGDWKHDHLRLKLLVKEQLQSISCVSEVTQEDGSDCFSAIHRFVFK